MTQEYLAELEQQMLQAAELLEFERAAQLWDRIQGLKKRVGESTPVESEDQPGFARSGARRRGGSRRERRSQGTRSRGRVPRLKRGDGLIPRISGIVSFVFEAGDVLEQLRFRCKLGHE